MIVKHVVVRPDDTIQVVECEADVMGITLVWGGSNVTVRREVVAIDHPSGFRLRVTIFTHRQAEDRPHPIELAAAFLSASLALYEVRR